MSRKSIYPHRQDSQKEALYQAVRYWASRIGVWPARVYIQPMTRKWASCSTTGWIRLSQDLLSENAAFREMVIVHELIHLQVPNHGKLFKSLMNAYVPQWQEIARGKAARLCSYGGADSTRD
jgi:predicted metal-dependent hydrolase